MPMSATNAATACAIALAFVLSACEPQNNSIEEETDTFELSETEQIESGREIVEMQCAFCHAVGTDDQSPRMDAPPLRTVLAGYPPDALAEDFREQVHIGHPDMPDFDFGPIGTDHVLAYLISIQVTEDSAE